MKLVHSILTHWPAKTVDLLCAYLKELQPEVQVVIAYGGQRSEFSQIRHANSVFLDDPSLRGSTEFQNYSSWVAATVEISDGSLFDTEWVYFSECDCLPLRGGYLDTLIESAIRVGGDFFGYRCADRSNTNDYHYLRHRDHPGLRQLIEGISVRGGTFNLWGFLQISWLIRAEALFALAKVPMADAGYSEITIPTVVHHLGYSPKDFSALGPLYDFVRYRPAFELHEVRQAAAAGATFLHPFKDYPRLAAFAAIAGGRDPESAGSE